MSKKLTFLLVGIVIAVIFACVSYKSLFEVNDVAQIQVVQSVRGKTTIRKEPGFYIKAFASVWTYDKTRQVAFSFEEQESKDNDGAEVFFSDRSKGKVSFQITYELLTDNESVLRMHALAKGDDDVLDKRILAVLRETAICEAGKFTATDASTDKKGEFIEAIRSKLLNNKDFEEIGIKISQFTITKVLPDEKTVAAFEQAREAEQQKRIAEVQEAKFVMEKKRVEAEAAMQIAEAKGKAEVEKTKAETDAEKEKKLAEIAGEQRVAVAELDKKEAEAKAQKEAEVAKIEAQKQIDLAELKAKEEMVEAQKKIDVAELAKKEAEVEAEKLASVAKIEADKTKNIAIIEAEKEKEVAIIDMNAKKEQALIQKDAEATNLEIEKLIAEQVVTKAKAEKEAIEVGGKMSEKDKLTLTVVNETKVKIAEAIAKAFNGLKLPGVMYFGGGFGANGEKAVATAANYFGDFMNLLTVQKATELANQTGNATK